MASNQSKPPRPDQPTQDLHYLLSLGIPVDNIAHRIGRTATAVRHHIRHEAQQIEDAA